MATRRWLVRAAAGGLAACLALAPARVALATNALNLTGAGAASAALGGTDAASFHDTSAINANPATLALLPARGDGDPHALFSAGRMDLSLAVLGPTPGLLLALDAAWHNWSALEEVTIRAKNPGQPQAPASVRIPIETDWHDQWVVSAGIAYDVVPEELTLRGGYNFGNNQVPDRTLSPAVSVVYEHHLGAGVGYRPDRQLQMDLAFTYALENRVTYTNRGMPFGLDAVEAPAGLQVDPTLGYRF